MSLLNSNVDSFKCLWHSCFRNLIILRDVAVSNPFHGLLIESFGESCVNIWPTVDDFRDNLVLVIVGVVGLMLFVAG